MNLGNIEIDLNDILGESIAILGIKGSGKTNTSAVLAEEILPHVPMTIIDPEGEYYGLKERYPLLIAGSGKQAELQVGVANAAALADFAYRNRLSIILDLSNFRKAERHDFLTEYLGALWTVASDLRQPHFLLLEEARQFIPQTDRSELRDLLTDYALMGRKRGVGLIIVNQRSSNIAKDVLTQAGILLLHRVAHSADMTIYKDLIPGMTGKEVEASVRGLTTGTALFVRGDGVQVAHIRQRHTTHGGSTPGIGAAPQYRALDAKLLASLRETFVTPAEAQKPTRSAAQLPPDKAAQLEARCTLVEGEIKILTKTLARLERELAEMKAMMPSKMTPEELAKVKQPQIVPLTQKPAPAPAKSDGMPKSTSAPVDLGAAQRVAKRESIQVNRQRAALERAAEFVAGLPMQQRYLLYMLMGQPSQWFAARVAAQKLGYNEDRFIKNPPVKLVDMGLLERNGSTYRIASTLRNKYPDLEQVEITEKLRAACAVRV